MGVLFSAMAFLFLLSFLVLVHEAGHFFAARRAGVIVEEFGFGLPPRAKVFFVWHGTRFSLNWIPFGGFVRLKGENAVADSKRRQPGSFAAASYPARIIILTAGVAMNFFLALVIFVFGFWAGRWVPTYVSLEEMKAAAERGEIQLQPGVLIEDVIPGGAAAAAGVPLQSLLMAVDDVPVFGPGEIAPLQKDKDQVVYTVRSGEGFSREERFIIAVREGRTGVGLSFYPANISVPSRSLVQGLLLSFREARVVTVQSVIGLLKLFGTLFSAGRVPEGITGIVGIAQLTHASVREGIGVYLQLVAVLSLSLAVINILPIPALDGGRLAFVLLEMVRRRPANRTVELLTNALGFVFLILLILVITYHDLLRLF